MENGKCLGEQNKIFSFEKLKTGLNRRIKKTMTKIQYSVMSGLCASGASIFGKLSGLPILEVSKYLLK